MNGVKRKEHYITPDLSTSFQDWAVGKSAINDSLDPWDRAQRLLAEIQKRSLAEHVLLLSWDTRRETCQTLAMAPTGDKPVFSDDVRLSLIRRAYVLRHALFWKDLRDDEPLIEALRKEKCHTITVYPLTIQNSLIDALVIVNYSTWRDSVQVTEYVSFISSVLALAIQNLRLYLELEKKDLELREWSGHVEKRIDEGTKKLIEREHQYQALFEATLDGILVHDGTGKIIEVNQAASRLLGYDKRELMGMTWSQLGISDVLPEQIAFFGRIRNRERLRPLETLLRRKDGTTVHVELSSQYVRFRDRDTIQSLIHDVTMRKNLEKSYRESKEKYRLFLESSLVGVFIIWDGVVHFANSMFEDITGYEQEDLLEMNFYDLIAPEDRELVRDRETRREKDESVPNHYEIRILKKGGVTTWVEIRACRIVLDGKPAVLGNVIDLTHSKQVQENLLESQKMEAIGTLAGGIAHDFNNLLGGILGYASLLLSEMSETHPYRDDVHAIAETTNRAADLSNRLLAFARGGKYRVATLDLSRMLNDVVDVYKDEFENIGFHLSVEDGLWETQGDTGQIQQSVQNIVQNAVDAMPEGGELHIALSNVSLDERTAVRYNVPSGDYVRIEFSDTGIGMSDESRRRIFEPFYTTKTGTEGTGLGMSMVYGIVMNHDGVIQIQSREGEGTLVIILLPRFEVSIKKEIPLSPAVVAEEPKEIKTVLIVDDEAVIRHVVRRMLEQGGYHVMTAENGRQAIERYQENRDKIDLVLLDLIMPVMGGKETYRRLKNMNPQIKIALTSGYSPLDWPEYSSLDCPFIQKPFRKESLLQHIYSIIEAPAVFHS